MERWILLSLLLACGDKDDTTEDEGWTAETTGGTTTETATETTGGTTGGTTDTGTTSTAPSDPTPFELTIAGDMSETFTFDQYDCTYPMGSTNLRVFWRDSAQSHYFVLVAELLGTFEGQPGTFTETEHGARVKMQEEAGGENRYFASGEGDTVEIVVDTIDETSVYGSFSVSAMGGEDGTITLSPQPIPIWCPQLN